jgi:DNA repair exonuclease SbcCD ATPase subunit
MSSTVSSNVSLVKKIVNQCIHRIETKREPLTEGIRGFEEEEEQLKEIKKELFVFARDTDEKDEDIAIEELVVEMAMYRYFVRKLKEEVEQYKDKYDRAFYDKHRMQQEIFNLTQQIESLQSDKRQLYELYKNIQALSSSVIDMHTYHKSSKTECS